MPRGFDAARAHVLVFRERDGARGRILEVFAREAAHDYPDMFTLKQLVRVADACVADGGQSGGEILGYLRRRRGYLREARLAKREPEPRALQVDGNLRRLDRADTELFLRESRALQDFRDAARVRTRQHAEERARPKLTHG